MKEEILNHDEDNNIYKFIDACKEDLDVKVELIRKVKINYMSNTGFKDYKITYVLKLILKEGFINGVFNIDDIKNKVFNYSFMYGIQDIIIADSEIEAD